MIGLNKTEPGRYARKVLPRNGQGFLTRQDISKLVRAKQIRVRALNIGSLTGKTEELAGALRKTRVDICARQETRWFGAKSCDIERERNKNG